MKRSEINAIMRDADAFIKQHQFHLPPFAFAADQLYLSGIAQQPVFSLVGHAEDRPGGFLLKPSG